MKTDCHGYLDFFHGHSVCFQSSRVPLFDFPATHQLPWTLLRSSHLFLISSLSLCLWSSLSLCVCRLLFVCVDTLLRCRLDLDYLSLFSLKNHSVYRNLFELSFVFIFFIVWQIFVHKITLINEVLVVHILKHPFIAEKLRICVLNKANKAL